MADTELGSLIWSTSDRLRSVGGDMEAQRELHVEHVVKDHVDKVVEFNDTIIYFVTGSGLLALEEPALNLRVDGVKELGEEGVVVQCM